MGKSIGGSKASKWVFDAAMNLEGSKTFRMCATACVRVCVKVRVCVNCEMEGRKKSCENENSHVLPSHRKKCGLRAHTQKKIFVRF